MLEDATHDEQIRLKQVTDMQLAALQTVHNALKADGCSERDTNVYMINALENVLVIIAAQQSDPEQFLADRAAVLPEKLKLWLAPV